MQVLCLIPQHSRRLFLVSNTRANAVLPSMMAVCTRVCSRGGRQEDRGHTCPWLGTKRGHVCGWEKQGKKSGCWGGGKGCYAGQPTDTCFGVRLIYNG